LQCFRGCEGTEMANNYFAHPDARVESESIGVGTRIWAFAHVLPGAVIGCENNICDHVFIENDVRVGDRVTIKSGVQLWDGLQVGDDVFIGPNATFTNDRFPRSKQRPEAYLRTVLSDYCSIGAGAVILPGLVVGRGAMVGAGAVVTRDVPPYAVVVGNPGRIVGYAGIGELYKTADALQSESALLSSRLAGVQRVEVPHFRDLRGLLGAVEVDSDLPFVPRRLFFIYNVPTQYVRGEHAHRTCQQMLICLRGSLNVVLDDGRQREEHVLKSPDTALYVPPMIWASQYKYTADALLLVLASEKYDSTDYIRNYDEWRAEIGRAL
jgi:UDP-2-acetamido-3-amino-2,3-dideoxy-glucuronate N-acetyltransferase